MIFALWLKPNGPCGLLSDKLNPNGLVTLIFVLFGAGKFGANWLLKLNCGGGAKGPKGFGFWAFCANPCGNEKLSVPLTTKGLFGPVRFTPKLGGKI